METVTSLALPGPCPGAAVPRLEGSLAVTPHQLGVPPDTLGSPLEFQISLDKDPPHAATAGAISDSSRKEFPGTREARCEAELGAAAENTCGGLMEPA